MAETIDVLNEKGVKTGHIATRTEVHQKGLWHRAVIVCVINDNNEILMQRRSLNKEKYPGLWDISVAAHVRSGEDAISTASRELNEEINIPIEYTTQIRDFRYITSFINQHVVGNLIENQFYDLFVIRRNIETTQLNYTDDEVMDAKWVNYVGLQELLKEKVLHPRLEWVDEVVRYINRF